MSLNPFFIKRLNLKLTKGKEYIIHCITMLLEIFIFGKLEKKKENINTRDLSIFFPTV